MELSSTIFKVFGMTRAGIEVSVKRISSGSINSHQQNVFINHIYLIYEDH